MLAKQAATVDEISGGRLVLGIGAGWNPVEFAALGAPFDHRIAPVRGVVHDRPDAARATGTSTSRASSTSAREAELLPRPARPAARRCSIGSVGPRMLAATLPYVDAWNAWYADTGNRPRASRRCGRASTRRRAPPAATRPTIERTVAVLVRLPGGTGRVMGDTDPKQAVPPLGARRTSIADALRAYAREGIGHVQLVLDPITEASVEALAPVLERLDRG